MNEPEKHGFFGWVFIVIGSIMLIPMAFVAAIALWYVAAALIIVFIVFIVGAWMAATLSTAFGFEGQQSTIRRWPGEIGVDDNE